MKTLLSATAILALSCAPVYAGNVQTFHGSEHLRQEAEKPMGGSNAAWIIPLIAIIAIAASQSGGGKEPEEPVDPCTCKNVPLIPGDKG